MSYDNMPNYDAWLERPYQQRQAQEPPGDVEDMLDVEFWLDGERAVVESWEEWSEAERNDDGSVSRYGGYDFVIRTGGTKTTGPLPYWTGGRTRNMSPTELQEVLANQDEHKDEDAEPCPQCGMPFPGSHYIGCPVASPEA